MSTFRLTRKSKSVFIDDGWKKQNVRFYTYREAQRRRGPLYAVLIKQLYEDNCLYTARYFQFFVLKEKRLLDEFHIIYRLTRAPDLLITIVENLTYAEKSANSTDEDGMYNCLTKLHETQLLVRPLVYHYDWFVVDMHRIFIRITENYKARDMKSLELKSKIFCAYANFLRKEAMYYRKCFKYFNKSLDLCRGEDWSAEGLSTSNKKYTSLQEYVAVQMTKAFTRYAKIAYSKNDTLLALHLLRQAIFALEEVRDFTKVVLLLDTYFCRIRYLYSNADYQTARDELDVVKRKYMNLDLGEEYGRLNSEFILLKTMVQNELKHRDSAALKRYSIALDTSRRYSVKSIEAESLLQMAKVYMRYHLYQDKAKIMFLQSKLAFGTLMDYANRNIALYNLAKLTAKQHFKEFKKLLFETEFNYCALYRLYWWKYRGVPFWDEPKEIDSEISLEVFDDIPSITRTEVSDFINYFRIKSEAEVDCLIDAKYFKA